MFLNILLSLPILLLFAWLIGDIYIYAYLKPTYGTKTITTRIQEISSEYIAIPFMTGLILGLLFGHLFGQF